MPGKRIANATAALLASGSIVFGQPLPAEISSPASAPLAESFVEVLTGPNAGPVITMPGTNCGCKCSSDG